MKDRKAPQARPTADPASETWNRLPWKKLEKHTFRIQKRIYRASQCGNVRAVHTLQKLLTKSEAARLVAVRRVTQDNQGKKTAGVDGVKSVPPKQRFDLVKRIHPNYWKRSASPPARRVWIPKPGKTEQRPLGIPTMFTRAQQALGKMALEPEWEARFEPNSYGFRPGRSCQDAIEAILNAIRYKPKFVFDADISGCFDNINHSALLAKLNTYPAMRHVVKLWLKAGVVDTGVFAPTEKGTPQGGVASPLLANIALHGMEQVISTYHKGQEKALLVRYADDFVLVHSEKEVLDQAARSITEWLGDMGLELKPSKTKVTHTLTPLDGNVGFDFLGFTIRQFPVGKTHPGRHPHGRPLGFKTIIKPSKEAVKRHIHQIKQRVRALHSASQEQVIKVLNPVIGGWANYYRTVPSKKTFSWCDHTVYVQLTQWARHKHPTRGRKWLARNYWRTKAQRHWVFMTLQGVELRDHSQTAISYHTKVRGGASPYDGQLLYWSQRLKQHPLMEGKLARLLKDQQGKCRYCGLVFKDGDIWEIDHLVPKSQGGRNTLSNCQVLHRHCHDQRHADLAKAGISLN
jgi:RNA-directed DNA polymerase